MEIRKPGASAQKMLGLLALLALITGAPGFAQDMIEPELAPDNPAFVDRIYGPQMQTRSIGEIQSGLVPEPFVLPQPDENLLQTTNTLPVSFDLRTQGKLTAVRNQGSAGACWAFATYGSMESFLLPGENWDFSENNLKNLHGFDIAHNMGGNRAMSTAYLARWAGPITEAMDPYNPTSGVSQRGLAPAKRVQSVIFLPVRTGSLDNTALKQAVMTYGAVYTTYYHSDTYYNSSTAAYYFPGASNANHAVCIVGWDDNYLASRFRTAPPGNGAFLIRNSWGSYWGMGGYFWMSYYDSRLGRTENAVFTADPLNTYKTIYQYDDLGWVTSMGYGSNTAWFANVFTATTNDPIVAASWYSGAPNASYQLYVYTNPTSGPINSSGPAALKTGTLPAAGYHTVALDTPVPVTTGQKFSVVVRVSVPGYTYPIPLERPYSGYASRATALAGQSYVSSSGSSWSDVTSSYPGTNVCLKAFGGDGGTTPPPPTPGTISVNPATAFSATGNQGGPFSPSSQAYQITNTGQSAVNWAAATPQTWLSLSSTGGSLAAGASVTVTASINAGANALAAGNYSGTITFANTTNSNGNTSRNVSLNVTSPTPGPGVLSVNPTTGIAASGTAGGPFSPSTQTYTLSNTGQSSIYWSASRTQSWVTLSSTGGSLAAGATAQVTVSINSLANNLAAGSYADTVSFANTTNGTGNASVPVSLSVTTSGGGGETGTYRVMPEPFNWINPTGHTRLALGDNAVSPAIDIPFGFRFYGKTYNRIWVSSNGLVSFGGVGLTAATNTDIPRTYVPNGALYPYWDDLNPARGGAIYVGVEGNAPNRKVVVSWVDVPWGNAPLTVRFSFQAILTEGSSDVVYQYLNVSPDNYYYGAGRSATIGIENEYGTLACKHSFNRYGAVLNNMSLRIGLR